jgi:hypothetical protein
MFLSPSWAVALIASGLVAVLVIVQLRGLAMRWAESMNRLLHLLAGGLIGFVALAFYPAWPLLAAVGGMLAIRAARSDRWADVGLLAIGVGAVWVALLGASVVNDWLDSAVLGGDQTIPILVGALAVLVGSVLVAGWRPGDLIRS